MNTEKLSMTPALRSLLRITFPDYRGRKYQLKMVRSVTLLDRDWSGGTHADYMVLRDIGNGIETAETPPFSPMAPAAAYAPTIDLPAGYVVVSHRWFCGHDCGITVYANPDGPITAALSSPKLLTA